MTISSVGLETIRQKRLSPSEILEQPLPIKHKIAGEITSPDERLSDREYTEEK